MRALPPSALGRALALPAVSEDDYTAALQEVGLLFLALAEM